MCALAITDSQAEEAEATVSLPSAIAAIRADMQPFRDVAIGATPALDAFQRHYGLPVTGCARKSGFIEVDHTRIFVQTFRPAEPRGGVLVVHGYYDKERVQTCWTLDVGCWAFRLSENCDFVTGPTEKETHARQRDP